MRSILEKAFVALLNEEQDKAEELFHKFMVERARQIHESLREGEDVDMDECEKEVTEETHFNEEDLAELEEGDYSEEYANEDEEMPEDDMSDEESDEYSFDSDEVYSDEDSDEDAVDSDEDDMDSDEDDSDTDMSSEERIDSLEDQIEKLTAEFEAILDAIGDDDSEEGEEEHDSEEHDSDDVDSDEVDSDEVEDFDDADMEEMPESEMYEDFNDLTESIIDELEKVKVSLEDGKEIGTGSKIDQNTGAAIPQKNKEARMGGEPIKMKSAEHKGYARETAPATKDMPKRRNTRPAATAGMDKVSKEGNKSAEINKLSSESGNTTSPLQGTKNVVK